MINQEFGINIHRLLYIREITKKFQIYRLDLEKAEEPEIKLPTYTGS